MEIPWCVMYFYDFHGDKFLSQDKSMMIIYKE